MERRTKQREGWLRGKYPEVHSKTVDLITRTIDNGTLYFTRPLCLRYVRRLFKLVEVFDGF